MGSLKDPKTWIPRIIPKDCSQKVCSVYCTQWCKYVVLPSPAPPPQDDLGGATLSPAVIVIIAVLGTFLLLISYYVLISRYCYRINESSVSSSTSTGIENQEMLDPETEMDDHDAEGGPSSLYVPWLVSGKGLDESLIKSITICKYKRGDGLVSCTDCSVCLGEFQEDESIRLLPKCSHAFHVYCIDTWLRTHSNCPLCRANVCCDVKPPPLISPPPSPSPPPLPVPPVMISEFGGRKIRRSKSMGYLCRTQASIAELVLFIDQDEEVARQELRLRGDAGSSENKGLNVVNVSYVGTKRSYSSGRYLFARVN